MGVVQRIALANVVLAAFALLAVRGLPTMVQALLALGAVAVVFVLLRDLAKPSRGPRP